MYKKLDLYRKTLASRRSEMIVIGYWEPEEGPAIVKTFTYIDEHGHTTNFQNATVIGRTLIDVTRDQEGCGFTQ